MLALWLMTAKGQTEKNSVRANVFRFALELRHRAMLSSLRICVKTGPHEPRRRAFYSITASARTTMEVGTVRPSTVAVLTFTATSNLTGTCTGRSAGLVPRSILST